MGLNYALLPFTGWEWLRFWPKWKTVVREEGEGRQEEECRTEGDQTKGETREMIRRESPGGRVGGEGAEWEVGGKRK